MRYKGTKKPVQFYWEDEIKAQFINVVRSYDSELSMSSAVLKLVKWAVQEHWLPGYIQKPKMGDGMPSEAPTEKPSRMIDNKLQKDVQITSNHKKTLDIRGHSR